MNYIQTYQVDVEQEYKLQLELAIDMVKEQHDCHWNKFTSTDYKIKYKDNIPKYQEILLGLITPHLEAHAAEWGCQTVSTNNIWFAEYTDGAQFGWHTHEGCNMSAVYVIDLENPEDATQLHAPGQGINTMVSGELIVFPSMVPHKSPVVNEGYKLIVGINWNMFGCHIPYK